MIFNVTAEYNGKIHDGFYARGNDISDAVVWFVRFCWGNSIKGNYKIIDVKPHDADSVKERL